jgi:DNA-binding transcriptional MerR regulator
LTVQNDDETRLKIGAVSRLTGLSVHTVRKWEERYGAVTPIRTERGQRLYSLEDVRRLALIRRLTQAGLPLNDIGSASTARLERTADSMAPAADDSLVAQSPPKNVRAVVMGDTLPAQLNNAKGVAGLLRIVASGDTLASVTAVLGERVADALICELPSVHGSSWSEVEAALTACRLKTAVVVYGFGSSASLNALRRPNVALMRAPIDPGNLQRTVFGLISEAGGLASDDASQDSVSQEEHVPAPRFSRKAIARVVTTSPAMQCECPHHIASLLFGLRAFEDYCERCENDNPDDAALHRYLKVTAGISRAAFEEALARVAEAEGIRLES